MNCQGWHNSTIHSNRGRKWIFWERIQSEGLIKMRRLWNEIKQLFRLKRVNLYVRRKFYWLILQLIRYILTPEPNYMNNKHHIWENLTNYCICFKCKALTLHITTTNFQRNYQHIFDCYFIAEVRIVHKCDACEMKSPFYQRLPTVCLFIRSFVIEMNLNIEQTDCVGWSYCTSVFHFNVSSTI